MMIDNEGNEIETYCLGTSKEEDCLNDAAYEVAIWLGIERGIWTDFVNVEAGHTSRLMIKRATWDTLGDARQIKLQCFVDGFIEGWERHYER
jgi:hypothetical protein